MLMSKISIIGGGGNMAKAIINGMLNNNYINRAHIVVSDKNKKNLSLS